MSGITARLLDLVYVLVLAAFSPLLAWVAWRKGKYREGWSEKFLGRVPQRDSSVPCLWLHAVSVGEVAILRTLIPALQSRFEGWQMVVSTTTKTGRDLLRRQHPDLVSFYCPLDFSWATNAAMRRLRPQALVLVELELWPNLIRAAKLTGAKVLVVNGRLSEKSFRGYSRIGWMVRRMLRHVDTIAVQDDRYLQRFLQLGALPSKTHVTGSIKFDGAELERDNPLTRDLAAWWQIDPTDQILVAGSTQDPEERLALEAYGKLREDVPTARLILVPRHPDRFDEVAALLAASPHSWCRRSQSGDGDSNQRTDVLLVDTIGELRAWWGTALAGFVGGSLGSRGGQNMIEPSAYGVAVCFGPRTQNFRDVVQLLLAAEAASVVRDGKELEAFWRRCLNDPAFASERGTRARQVVLSQTGATQRTVTELERVLKQTDG